MDSKITEYLTKMSQPVSLLEAIDMIERGLVEAIRCNEIESDFVTIKNSVLLRTSSNIKDMHTSEYIPNIKELKSKWHAVVSYNGNVNKWNINIDNIKSHKQTAIFSHYNIGHIGDVLMINDIILRITGHQSYFRIDNKNIDEMYKRYKECGFSSKSKMKEWYINYLTNWQKTLVHNPFKDVVAETGTITTIEILQ